MHICMILKGNKTSLFYSHEDNKLYMFTKTIFLKSDYTNNSKHRSNVLLEELHSDDIRQTTPVGNDIQPIIDIIV